MTIIDTRTSNTPYNYIALVAAASDAVQTTFKQIPCHNYHTARLYSEGRAPAVTTAVQTSRTVEQAGGCQAGGAGYDAAVTWAVTGRVERCRNWASANTIARNNPVTIGAPFRDGTYTVSLGVAV